MAIYEATDKLADTSYVPVDSADSARAEAFAAWDQNANGLYMMNASSEASVLGDFGELVLFDSPVDGSSINGSDYTAPLTSSDYQQVYPSAGVSLDPIEFSGAAPITDYLPPESDVSLDPIEFSGAAPITDYLPPESDVSLNPIEFSGASPVAESPTTDTSVQHLFDANFDRLDQDGNGFVSEQEIDQAMINPDFTGEDAALVAMLKDQQDELELLSNDEWFKENDGITRADMAEFAELQAKTDKTRSEQELVDGVEDSMSSRSERIAQSNHDLFANEDNPLASISPEAVKQGRIDDCAFLADVAALAATSEGQQAIYDMIQANDDGTYTVTFPGAPNNPVTITAPTDAELAYYAGGSEHGTWAAVLEKAYGEYCDSTKLVPQDGVPSGSPIPGFELLTGKTVDRDLIDQTLTVETAKKLQKAMEDGRPSTVVSRRQEDLPGDSDITGSHAYSVVGYNSTTQEIELRNPWGHGEPLDKNGNPADGKNDGVFTMTLAEFEKHFGRVLYVEE